MKFRPFALVAKALSSISASRGGWLRVLESYPGAWQQNVEVKFETVLENPFVFRCQAMIARDIAKLRVKVVAKKGRIWEETDRPGVSSLLRRLNGFQTRNQFWESYFLSKLARGNTYVLKQRDGRGAITKLYVLDPDRVWPLVSQSGDVFYQLATDHLAGLGEELIVPAREIIHDRWNCLFHPLVGLSPIFANGLAATQAQTIASSSANFFGNQARPGGILTAPGAISDATAKELKESFSKGFSGKKAGEIAVVGDGLTFQTLNVHATDAQLVEQLKWTSETIATTYGIPLYKVGLGTMPTANNTQGLNIEYYSQALQGLIEDAESCFDEGLGLDGVSIGVEFDVDGLWRMDSATQMRVLEQGKSLMTLNERRARLDLPPVEGGDTIYLQQQDHSLEAIAALDRALIDEAKRPKVIEPPPAPVAPVPEDQTEKLVSLLRYKMQGASHA